MTKPQAPNTNSNSNKRTPQHQPTPSPNTPAPDPEATLKFRNDSNLRNLQRKDKTIHTIITSASHAVMYELTGGSTNPKWEKTGVEGSLFIVKRSDARGADFRYRVMVLNRNNPSDFIQDVNGRCMIKIMEKLLMFKVSETDAGGVESEKVKGIYFQDESERDVVFGCLGRVIGGSIQGFNEDSPPVSSVTASASAVEEGTSAKKNGGVDEIATSLLLSQLGIVRDSTPTMRHPTPPTATPNSNTTPQAKLVTTTKTTTSTSSSESTTSSSSSSSQPPPLPPSTPTQGGGAVLDKKSLQLALLSLIQDERFVDLIHAQYTKITQARNR